jgi:choline dehydrogenase-like flavoprotein
MFVGADALTSDVTQQAEFCIFGSGPAGMTLAVKLAKQGRRVILVEAGAMDYEDWSQDFYKGQVVGDQYFDLSAARLRMFGGTSNHWGGRCIPMDAGDFMPRSFVLETGWPITIDELQPHLAEACDILEIENDFTVQEYSPSIRRMQFQWSAPILFGEKYHDMIAASENLNVFLETALVGLEREGGRIRGAKVRRRGGDTVELTADKFIMCLGGIENSRMLLWINAQNNEALIPGHDAIGRYWMEHPYGQMGEVLFENLTPDFFDGHDASFSLTHERQNTEGVLNAVFDVERYSYSGAKALVADVACIAPELGARLMHGLGRGLVCGARVHGQWEQAPHRDNRVMLAKDTDAFGIPHSELHWKRKEEDRNTIMRSMKVFAEETVQSDQGRVRMAKWITRDAPFPVGGRSASWHHMGGTRMSADPTKGVVDSNLKVHGLGNLYIAGSSVFPTGGYANPTLTIVQLSLRLAKTLEART